MHLNRRQWLKTTALAGGFTLFNGLTGIQTLSAEEVKKFNPRKLASPIRLSSNENPKEHLPNVQRLERIIRKKILKGYTIDFHFSVNEMGNHSEVHWREEFPEAVKWLFLNS